MNIHITERLVRYLNHKKTGTIILEPQVNFNKAIIGYHPSSNRLIYSMERLIEVYREDMIDVEDDTIIEYIYYNICFGYLTPIIFDDRWEVDKSEHASLYDLNEGEEITQFLGIHHIEDLRSSSTGYIEGGRIPNCS